MRRTCSSLRLLLLVAWLPACSIDEDRFVAELTTGDCAYALSCWDSDVLTQYGFDDQEACEAVQGPIVAQIPVDCAVYDKRKARECKKALKERACIDDALPAELGRPEVCESVFTSCEGEDNGE